MSFSALGVDMMMSSVGQPFGCTRPKGAKLILTRLFHSMIKLLQEMVPFHGMRKHLELKFYLLNSQSSNDLSMMRRKSAIITETSKSHRRAELIFRNPSGVQTDMLPMQL